MIKSFIYTVAAIIQNKITGFNDTILTTYEDSIVIDPTTHFAEFLLEQDTPINYVIASLEEYVLDNGITLNDIHIIKIEVTSGDDDVVVYFKHSNDTQILFDAPIYAYIDNILPYIDAPTNLSGTAYGEDIIVWEWEAPGGLSFKIKDENSIVIANVGIGIRSFVENNLRPNENYTRYIMAYNEDGSSNWSSPVTVSTNSTEMPEFTRKLDLTIDEPVNLSPISPYAEYDKNIISGVGDGDDLKVVLTQSDTESFDVKARVYGIDKESSAYYPSQVFKYRQKTSGVVNKEASYGEYDYELYAHAPSKYSAKLNASLTIPVNIQRNTTISLLTEANGPAITTKEYKYKIDAEIEAPINVRRQFEFYVNSTYNTSYNLKYAIEGDIAWTESAPKTDIISINMDVPKETVSNNWTGFHIRPLHPLIYLRARAFWKDSGEIIGGYEIYEYYELSEEDLTLGYYTMPDRWFPSFPGDPSVPYGGTTNNNCYVIVDILSGGAVDPRMQLEYSIAWDTELEYDHMPHPIIKNIKVKFPKIQIETKIVRVSPSVNLSNNYIGSNRFSFNVVNITDDITGAGPKSLTFLKSITLNNVEIPLTLISANVPTGTIGVLAANYTASSKNQTYNIRYEYKPELGISYPYYLGISKSIAEFTYVEKTAIVTSNTITYNSLKSFNKYDYNINNKNVVDIVNALVRANSTYNNKTITIKNIRVLNKDTSTNIIKFNIGTDNKIGAMNTIPDYYEYKYTLTGTVYANDSLTMVQTQSDINNCVPKIVVGSTTYLAPSNTQANWIFTLQGTNNKYVTVQWDGYTLPSRVGATNVYASSKEFIGKYSLSLSKTRTITTKIDQQTTELDVDDTLSSIPLRCSEIQDDGTVFGNDCIYDGDLSSVQFYLTKISGDVNIQWNNSVTNISNYNDTLHVSTNIFNTKYTKVHSIEKSMSSEDGDSIVLLDLDDVAMYKPAYDGREWPFSVNDIKYSVSNTNSNVLVYIDNINQKESIGPKPIYASSKSNIVTFKNTVVLDGYLYGYECPKQLLKLDDVAIKDINNNIYSGARDSITFTLTDQTGDITYTISDTAVVADINNKVDPVLVKSDVIWARKYPKSIPVDVSIYPANTMYELKKTGGNNNTYGYIGSTNNINNLNGTSVYSTTCDISVYAKKAITQFEDYVYGQWHIGTVNDGSKTSLVIPIEDYAREYVEQTSNELEIASNDNVNYTAYDGNFYIYSDYHTNTNMGSIDNTDSFVQSILSNRMVSVGEIKTINISIVNPKLSMPDMYYILSLECNNANIEISTNININDLPDDNTITIPVMCSILLDSQTNILAELVPGYYYLSAKEFYLGAVEQTIEEIEERKYKLIGEPIYNSPIIVKDSSGYYYSEVTSGIDIEETIEVINKRMLMAKYAGIDITTLFINNVQHDDIQLSNNIIILPSDSDDVTMNIRYSVKRSFSVEEGIDGTIINVSDGSNHKVYYNTNTKYNTTININPLRSLNRRGFIFIKD